MSMNSGMRAKAPLVTVVVISYNHARYLDCCLRSVFDQTYSNIEMVVVDNASTDHSREVIEAFRAEIGDLPDGRTFELFFSPSNMHLTKGMIAGFRRSKGAFVAFIDGDDYFLPACIETHVRAFLASRWPVGATAVDMYQTRDCDLVTGARKSFSEYVVSGRGQKQRFCRMDDLDAFALSRSPQPCAFSERDLHLVERRSGTAWVWSSTSALCFRREMVDLMFAYEPKILAGTDAYLVRGISALTGSITIDRPLSVYRQHGDNMFTAHPSLMNFDAHDKDELAKYEVEIATDIIECYRAQAAVLAARLDWGDIYIEAVDQISRIGPGLKHTRSSYVLDFLVDNRALLMSTFGETFHKRWMRRYTRIKDRLPAFAKGRA